ncbi:MAG: hypothetical protein ACOX87_14820 [Chloroflexota bacterium]
MLCVDYSGYAFARLVRHVACPVLLKMGAHTMPADVASVRDHAQEIAHTLMSMMAGFFGIATTPPLNTSELGQYAVWSLAPLDNGEDHRDIMAFRKNLVALGCADAPYRYGSPAS